MTRRLSSRTRSAAFSLSIALAGGLVSTVASAQVLYFDEVEGAFPDQECADEGCWTNYLRLSDLDGDGDLDAIFPNASGFFSSPGAQPLEIYLNDGDGAFELGTVTLLGEAVSGAYRVAAIGDVDGDGRRDLFLPSASGDEDRLFMQDDRGDFSDQAATRLGTSSRSAAARFGDVDGDGDLDLLIAAGYASSDSPPARLYLNDGDGGFSESVGALPASIGGSDPDDLDFVDVDGDFDLDVLVNTHTGKDALWINDGSGVFTDESARLPALEDPSAFHYGPAACDIDGDGDRDLLIDNVGPDYSEQVLINDGTGQFTAESNRLQGNDAGADDNGIVCIDFDDDGDLDVVVMSLSSPSERLFENDGTGHFTRLDGAFSTVSDPTLWMEAGDVNGDGRLDVITAQGEGAVQIERLYMATSKVSADTSPPAFTAIDDATFWPEVRFALQENSTSDEGPRIREAYADLGDDGSPIPATFMGGDLFRVVFPEETRTYSLCAVDLAGNLGCVEQTHGGGAGGGGAGGAGSGGAGQGGDTTSAGDGGFPPSATAVVGSGASTTSGGTGASSGQGGADGGQGGGDDRAILDDDGGCGCEVAGAPSSRPWLASIGLALGALLLRRRRTARRGARS